jgi:hypothetical protein
MAFRRSAPEGVLDLRPGLLEVALGLVTAALARRRRLPVTRPAVFLAPPLTASALCAIFLAMLTGLPFAGHSAGRAHRRGHLRRDIGVGLRGEGLYRRDGGLRVAGSCWRPVRRLLSHRQRLAACPSPRLLHRRPFWGCRQDDRQQHLVGNLVSGLVLFGREPARPGCDRSGDGAERGTGGSSLGRR